MICPICGFDMKDEKNCEKCGFELSENEQTLEPETDVDFDSLEKIEVDFEEVDGEQEVQEDEISETVENLEVDFDEINQNVAEEKKSKSGMWGVSFVSFIAGVLATLIVIGCLNGTIVSYFDRITNGTPYETVESFCDFYFFADLDADNMVKTFSPYYRAQIAAELAQYNFQNDVDLNFDLTDDTKFKDVADFYINLINDPSTPLNKIKSIDFDKIVYYKSDSEEFKTYLNKYKVVDNEAKGVALFANVSFKIKIDVVEVEQETTVPQTSTKKNKKSNKTDTTTTQVVTQAPKTTTESRIHNCSAVCVKINDEWKVFNIQVLS